MTGATRRHRLAGRAAWNLVDQVISSLTNAMLSVIVARSVGQEDFGGFAVAFTVFSVVVGLSRALATAPMLIRFSGSPREDFDRASGGALGTALLFGVVTGVISVATGAWLGGVAGNALVALGVVLPGLLVQDAWRQVFFASARPAAAALNDAVWAVLQVLAVAGLLLAHLQAAALLVLAWGAAALAAAMVGFAQSRARPAPRAARGWLVRHRDLTGVMIAEFATQQGALQGAMLIITAVGSLTVVGTLRGTQVLLGVMNVLFMATASFVLPEFARRRPQLAARHWTWGAIGVSVFVGGTGLVWGLLLLLLPERVGHALLGETWNNVSPVLLVAVLGQFVQSTGTGPATMLRAMDRAPVTFSLNAVQCPLAFVGGVAGALLAGAEGALWGFAAGYGLVAPFWWVVLQREVRRLKAGSGPRGADAHTPAA